ncbi:MAG: hypothetical protein ACPIOQ_12135 [Promethearchaeia archaeon]
MLPCEPEMPVLQDLPAPILNVLRQAQSRHKWRIVPVDRVDAEELMRLALSGDCCVHVMKDGEVISTWTPVGVNRRRRPVEVVQAISAQLSGLADVFEKQVVPNFQQDHYLTTDLDAVELLLDLRLNRIFVTNDVFTLHRSGRKRFEVDFTNNDGSVGGRRDCRDESLQCCPYVVVRSLGQPNLVRKVRPPATVLLSCLTPDA